MMKRLAILSLLLSICLPFAANADSLSKRLSGRILISTQGKGEAWYVNPADSKRYYLGRPADAFTVMRKLGVGVTEATFQKIAQEGMDVEGDKALAKSLAGKIILQVERNGEAWYVNPVDLKKYYLGRPEDAFKVMRRLGLGVRIRDLALIHKPGTDESIDQYSSYVQKTVKTPAGDFKVDLVMIDLSNPKLDIVTDTADTATCKTGCRAKPLISYVESTPGTFAAINGSYFDTNASKRNYYFFPIYNSKQKVLINDDQLKYWTTGPIMVFDQNNKFYYFKDSREFKSVEFFENANGVKIKAAIGNKPRLIENKMNTLIDWEVDEKQRTGKTIKNALGYKEGKMYIISAHNSTVPDLAMVCQALEMEYALNIDGGYSTALFYNDEFMISPGRDIPNAILFTTKQN
ncbi:phosphodiester glycosidase family protein [Candidatus Falkowbacteria bacterium]|nr:phosphodiester glycosidase family protein [Candidatus Falkowbacteria bacterium]